MVPFYNISDCYGLKLTKADLIKVGPTCLKLGDEKAIPSLPLSIGHKYGPNLIGY